MPAARAFSGCRACPRPPCRLPACCAPAAPGSAGGGAGTRRIRAEAASRARRAGEDSAAPARRGALPGWGSEGCSGAGAAAGPVAGLGTQTRVLRARGRARTPSPTSRPGMGGGGGMGIPSAEIKNLAFTGAGTWQRISPPTPATTTEGTRQDASSELPTSGQCSAHVCLSRPHEGPCTWAWGWLRAEE